MNGPPLISVLVPAYNHEKYVAACVESVMAQDWPRLELIIVDDGSTDATWTKVQELARRAKESNRFVRVEVATQANQGTRATLNRLCGMAHGDVVALIASDDMYLSGAFSAMMRPMMADENVGVVVGQNEFMDGDGRTCYWGENQSVVYATTEARYRTFNAYLSELSGIGPEDARFGEYESLVRCNHIANGCIIRRTCLERVVPLPAEAPLEDHWLHLQLAKICRYRAVPERTFRYRWHAGNSIKQSARQIAFRYRTLKWEECLVSGLPDPSWKAKFLRATTETHVRFALGHLLSIEKRATLEEKQQVVRLGGREFILRRKSRLRDMQLRVLAIVHVHYPARWTELATCLRNIADPLELIVTYSDEASVVEARRDFPRAKFLKCENVGYDVWPFIRAIQAVRLSDYDAVVKLHTKRDLPEGESARPFNSFRVDGARWREQLLKFLATSAAWERTKERLLDPHVGMVADRWVIAREKGVRYVAGTMFAAKPVVLKAFQSPDYSSDRFVPSDDSHRGTFAHDCEREFGRAVAACGLVLVGWHNSIAFWLSRPFLGAAHFVYRKKRTREGGTIVKVMKIPVYRSRGGTRMI